MFVDMSTLSLKIVLLDITFQILSCEQTVQMGQVFLSRKLSSTEVEAQQAVEEEQAEITVLEDRVARALELR